VGVFFIALDVHRARAARDASASAATRAASV
jgi:hypothetical protein